MLYESYALGDPHLLLLVAQAGRAAALHQIDADAAANVQVGGLQVAGFPRSDRRVIRRYRLLRNIGGPISR